MIQLKVNVNSVIDKNLEIEFDIAYNENKTDGWMAFIKAMPNVVDAVWDRYGSYTLITFESESYKNWFILRWS